MGGNNHKGGGKVNFSKVKLIIITSLLAVNILLGVLCVGLYYDRAYISEEEAAYASAHLSGTGIDVSFDTGTRRIYSLPVYTAKTDEKSIFELYKSISESFFDKEISPAAYVTTPSGYSVTVKNNGGEQMGTALLFDEMSVECIKEDKLLSIGTEIISKKAGYFKGSLCQDKEAEKIAKQFAKKALGNISPEYNMCGAAKYEGGTIVFFAPALSDTVVYDLFMNVYIRDSEVVYCIGNFITESPQRAYSIDLIDAVDAVYLFASQNTIGEITSSGGRVKVTDAEMNYKLIEYEQKRYYIIPSWQISYSANGTEKALAFDAVTGESTYIPF